jgi:hypothetical protein
MTIKHIYTETEKKWWEEKRYQCTRCHIYRVKYPNSALMNCKTVYFTSCGKKLTSYGKKYMNCTEYQLFENERAIKYIIE